MIDKATASIACSVATLREIGWKYWDPIGLINVFDDWRGSPIEDEYDSYLIHEAHLLDLGSSLDDIVEYFADISEHHMGLGPAKNGTEHLDIFVAELSKAVRQMK